LDYEDQSLWTVTEGDESSHSVAPLASAGLVVSNSQKAKALADGLEAQFQPVDDPSDPGIH
jgi:hypothetical protein